MSDEFDGYPFNLEIEEAVLGCVMAQPDLMPIAQRELQTDAFMAKANQEVFDAMAAVSGRGELEWITLFDELRRRGTFDNVGGTSLFGRFGQYATMTSSFGTYTAKARDYWLRRRMVDAGNDMKRLAWEMERPVRELVDEAHAALPVHVSSADDTLAGMDVVAKEVLDGILERVAAGGKIAGIKTGLSGLDFYLSGFKKDALYVFAARTSMGKSALACSMAFNVARDGHHVLYFSLEMSRVELGERFFGLETGLKLHDMQNALLTPGEVQKAKDGARVVSDMPISIDHRAAVSPRYIRSIIKRVLNVRPVDMVVVDNLHNMEADGKYDSEVIRLGEISRELKNLAREFRVPVLALAQLSRGNEQRNDKRPIMTDIRGSGQIEQDADVIVTIYRPEYYTRKNSKEIPPEFETVHLDVLKQRQGPTGSVDARFYPATVKFEDPDVSKVFATQEPENHHAVIHGTTSTTESDHTSTFFAGLKIGADGFLETDPFAD